MDSFCIDCKKRIDPRSKRCASCSKKGRLNAFYGRKHTQETKIKAVKKRIKNDSYKITDETRKKLSKAKKGHEVSIETRKKISEKNKGKNFGIFGDKHGMWKGGRYKKSSGYIMVHNPRHPNSTLSGYVPEHRLIMEKEIGRILDVKEVVHHINENVLDNRIENLKLFENNKSHMNNHYKERRVKCVLN